MRAHLRDRRPTALDQRFGIAPAQPMLMELVLVIQMHRRGTVRLDEVEIQVDVADRVLVPSGRRGDIDIHMQRLPPGIPGHMGDIGRIEHEEAQQVQAPRAGTAIARHRLSRTAIRDQASRGAFHLVDAVAVMQAAIEFPRMHQHGPHGGMMTMHCE